MRSFSILLFSDFHKGLILRYHLGFLFIASTPQKGGGDFTPLPLKLATQISKGELEPQGGCKGGWKFFALQVKRIIILQAKQQI